MKLETLKILQSLATRVPRVSLCRVEEMFPALKETSINQWPIQTYKYENKLYHNRFIEALIPETDSEVYSKKILKCITCKLTFHSDSSLSRHKAIHKKRFTCKFCGKVFDEKRYFTSHITVHTGEKLLPCKICDKSFRFRTSLITHMRRHAGIKPYSCEVCGKSFSDSGDCRKHTLIHLRPFSCEVCNKRFPRMSHLMVHKSIHGGAKDFKCTICPKSYASNQLLKVHILSHGEKLFACEVCGKKFHSCYLRHLHFNAIHNGKKHTCMICNKEFSFQSNLKRHFTVHSNERPYSCACNWKSKTKGELKSHLAVCKFVPAVHSGNHL